MTKIIYFAKDEFGMTFQFTKLGRKYCGGSGFIRRLKVYKVYKKYAYTVMPS